MLAGHFGLAAAVKAREPQVPLWALMLSTQLLDVLFAALLPFGIESYKPANGGYGDLTITADYTHSLVGAFVIALVATIVAAIPWGRRTGLVIGAVVFSHWILDAVVHRPDMAILPGNAGNLPRIGLGVWEIPWLSIALEFIFVAVGAYLYYHASMRTAVKAERQDARAGEAPKGYRRQALNASVVMFVLMVGTLVANVVLG